MRRGSAQDFKYNSAWTVVLQWKKAFRLFTLVKITTLLGSLTVLSLYNQTLKYLKYIYSTGITSNSTCTNYVERQFSDSYILLLLYILS